MKKRFLSVLLTLVMVAGLLSSFTLTARAEENLTDSTTNVTLIPNAEGYYQIGTANEMVAFANLVNAGNTKINGILTADITLNENLISKLTITTTGYAFNYGDATLKSDQTASVWTTIGSEASPYDGIFDGNEKSITGLYVNDRSNSATKNNGLFGYVTGTVKNVTVKDSYIGAYSHIGGIVGYLKGGTVENCHFLDSWMKTDNGHMGGVVGYAVHNADTSVGALISGCTSNITYYGYRYSGGIVGHLEGTKEIITKVTGCTHSGEVKGTSETIGGIAAYLKYATVENCINNGIVNGSRYIGGIVGSTSFDSVVASCVNNGNINITGDKSGGIVGDASTIIIKDCINNGKVTRSGSGNNKKDIGGIVGYVTDEETKITGCVNTGAITNNTGYTGGIAGYLSSGTIDRCYNTGSVISTDSYAGGITGYQNDGFTTNTYNIGSVSGTNFIGGISGQLSYGTISGCYSAAQITYTGTGTDVGGLTGRVANTAVLQDNYYDSTKYNGDANGSVSETIVAKPTQSNNNGVTTEQFASGEIAYLLNGGVSDDTVIWKQTLSTDTSPNFGGMIVYYDEENTKYYNIFPVVTITFDANGGSCSVESANTNESGTLDTLPVPTKDTNNNFVGWFDEEDNKITEETTFTSDTTVYAKWIVNTYETEWTGYAGTEHTIYFYMKDYLPADTAITSMSASLPLKVGKSYNTTYSSDINQSYVILYTKINDNAASEVFTITVDTSNYGTITIKATINLVDFEITAFDSATKTATIYVPVAGTYTLILADYEENGLNNLDTITVTTANDDTIATATSEIDITLGTGDKIMLWSDLENLAPKCEAYIVK